MTKPTKWQVGPARTQISLGIRPVWSESTLSAWRKPGSLATHWTQSEDSDQVGRIPKRIWVLAGRKVILLILSRGSSYFVDYPWSHLQSDWVHRQNQFLRISEQRCPFLFFWLDPWKSCWPSSLLLNCFLGTYLFRLCFLSLVIFFFLYLYFSTVIGLISVHFLYFHFLFLKLWTWGSSFM